jgi:hypothetical protein
MSKVLACLSGGVESTYGVYDLLKNTDHDVTLFHLYFRNHPRYEGETEACEHIVNWLEKNTREFGWKSVNLNYTGVNEITQPPHSADIYYTIVTTANICIDEKDYDEVRFFPHKDEYNETTFDIPFIFNLFDLTLSRFPTINTKLILDKNTIELTKEDIYNRIPNEIKKYIYSNELKYND